MYRKRSQSTANGEGPPKHKPPPPMKSGSSTEMLNKPQDKATNITETQPLSNYMTTNYYETNSAEPVTDLDDDNMGPPANGGTPNVWDGSGHPPEKDESTDETLPPYEPADLNDIQASPANITREESFMSQPMLV